MALRLSMLAAAVSVTLVASLAAQPQPAAIVFTSVTVVPMDRERTLPDQTVVVRGDRVAAIGPSTDVQIPAGATLIDGRGKFLMPGMAEMHAHIPGGKEPDAFMHRVLALFVANGITTIRGMLGDPRHLPLRAAVARGEVVGPTLYTSGPSFNGNSAPTPEIAVTMVRDQKAAGYDLLKIHPGVPRAAFDALAAEAKTAGIPFSGHVPADVGLERALAAPYHSIDHMDGYFEYAVAPDAPIDHKVPGFFGANFAGHLDHRRLAQAVADTRRAGVWIVPTQGLLEIFMSPASPDEMRSWPGVEYIPERVVAQWTTQRQQFMSQPGFNQQTNQRFLAERRKLLKALHDAGVDIALGSDAIQTFSVPGFSIVREMEAMVASGLTPYEVYVTGSRNVARFFGRQAVVGTVEAGQIADLVLVDANPLVTVANFARQTGTMVRGRWHPRAELLEQLRQMR
jgi:hypothetical protein